MWSNAPGRRGSILFWKRVGHGILRWSRLSPSPAGPACASRTAADRARARRWFRARHRACGRAARAREQQDSPALRGRRERREHGGGGLRQRRDARRDRRSGLVHEVCRHCPLAPRPHGLRRQRAHGTLPRQAAQVLPVRGDAAAARRGGHRPQQRRSGAVPERGRSGAADPRQLLLPGALPARSLGRTPAGGRRHEHGGARRWWRATWAPRA